MVLRAMGVHGIDFMTLQQCCGTTRCGSVQVLRHIVGERKTLTFWETQCVSESVSGRGLLMALMADMSGLV